MHATKNIVGCLEYCTSALLATERPNRRITGSYTQFYCFTSDCGEMLQIYTLYSALCFGCRSVTPQQTTPEPSPLTRKKPIYSATHKFLPLVFQRPNNLHIRHTAQPPLRCLNRRSAGKGGRDGTQSELERIGCGHIIRIHRCDRVGNGLTTMAHQNSKGAGSLPAPFLLVSTAPPLGSRPVATGDLGSYNHRSVCAPRSGPDAQMDQAAASWAAETGS